MTQSLGQKVRKLLADLGITQFDLALRLGLHPSNVAQYISGGRSPSAIICLYLAGLSPSNADREFWVNTSGVNAERRSLLLRALCATDEAQTSRELLDGVAALLADPHDASDKAIGDLIRRTVEIRRAAPSKKPKK